MEIRSVSVGVVAIKSVSTGLYLAMSKKGSLFGSVRIQPGNFVSGGQVSWIWYGRGGSWGRMHICIGVPNECLSKHVWLSCSEGKSQESCARKSRDRSDCYYQSWLYTWANWRYLQLELACSTVKIDSREKDPNQQWQRASWAHLSPCVPSANCCFAQQAFKSNHLSLLKSDTHQTWGVCGVCFMFLHLGQREIRDK